jgi:YD repeat-containing protein
MPTRPIVDRCDLHHAIAGLERQRLRQRALMGKRLVSAFIACAGTLAFHGDSRGQCAGDAQPVNDLNGVSFCAAPTIYLPPAPLFDFSGAHAYGENMGESATYSGEPALVRDDARAGGMQCSLPLADRGGALAPERNTVIQGVMGACSAAANTLGSVVKLSMRAPKSGTSAAGLPASKAPSSQGNPDTHTDQPRDAQDANLDPVNPQNGEFFMYRTDLQLPGKGVPLQFERSYHSRKDYDGPLGHGWDHSYNRRLIPTDSQDCEGELLYHAGLGRTYSLQKIGESALEIVYRADVSVHFEARGLKTTNGVWWTITHPGGVVEHYDSRGLLNRIEDAAGYGLQFTWEPAAGPTEWRLARIIDHGGHDVRLAYRGDGRLGTLTDVATGLTATYDYNALGELVQVDDAAGRREYYDYDLPVPKEPLEEKHVPEGYLHAACEEACAPSASSCHAAGVCDDVSTTFLQQCVGKLFECADSCGPACREMLNVDGAVPADVLNECLSQPDGCNEVCPDVCDDLSDEHAQLCDLTWKQTDSSCGTACVKCNERCGNQCSAQCSQATGYDPYTQEPFYLYPDYLHCFEQTCLGACINTCEDGFKDACRASLAAQCEENACPGACADACRDNGVEPCTLGCINGTPQAEGCNAPAWIAQCEQTDWASICHTGCVEGCVKAGRTGIGGAMPRYGFAEDLSHNLVRVYDGDHRLYLENWYGSDITKPSFDAVVRQKMGDAVTEMDYRDLRAEAEGVAPAPTGGPLAQYVMPLAEYESVDICPRGCARSPFYGDATEYVPWAGQLLMVKAGSTPGGLPVSKPSYATIPPTLLRVETLDGIVVARAVAGGSLVPSGFSFVVTTSQGTVTFKLRAGTVGVFDLSGTSAAKATLSELTIVTESGTGKLRAYAGRPRGLVHVAAGSCSMAFTATRTEAGQLGISPAGACSDDLLLAPLATTLDGAGYDGEYLDAGTAAFTGIDLLAPTELVPGRAAFALRRFPGSGAAYDLVGGPAGASAPRTLARAAFTAAASAPLFAVPPRDAATLAVLPISVFHVPMTDRPTGTVENVLYDTGAVFELPTGEEGDDCRYPVLGEPHRGSGDAAPGPRPVTATVVIDHLGNPWTFYYDEHGRSIRTVNHTTGAVRSRNYDTFGDLVALEQPMRDRVCVAYDGAGNVTEVVRFPVPGAPGPTAPIRQRFDYQTAPSRLTVVRDPRDLGKVLARYAWNPVGQLIGATDAFGRTTSLLPEPWGAPSRITTPDGTVTEVTYDPLTGLAEHAVMDAASAQPIVASTDLDAAGRPVFATGPLGATTAWSWSGPRLDSVASDADGLGTSVDFQYDGTGQVIVRTDATTRTTIAYDAFGAPRRVVVSALDGSVPDAVTCRRNGPDGLVLEEILPEGERVRYHHDGEGRVTSIERGLYYPDLLGSWDDDCPTKAPPAAPAFANGQVLRIDYDLNGRPYGITDARGARTAIVYDGFGRAIMVSDPDLDQQRAEYDALGNPVWTASYSAAGALVTPYRKPVTGDTGLLAMGELTYDAAGRLVGVSRWHFDENGAAVGDGRSTTTWIYDDLNRKVTVVDDNGAATTQTFDGAGRLTRTSYPTGDFESFDYSVDGHVVTHVATAPTPAFSRTERVTLTDWGAPRKLEGDAQGGNWPVMAEWRYDDQWRLIEALGPAGLPAPTDASRARTSVTYDAFGRTKTQSTTFGDATQELVSFVYDRNSRLVQRRSRAAANGTEAVTTYQYDMLDRVTRLDRPEGVWERYFYQGASALPYLRTDSRTIATAYEYTAAGQTKRVGAGGSDTSQWVYRDFVYDGLGRLLEAKDGASQATTSDDVVTYLRWDSLGGKRTEWNNVLGASQPISHVFDGAGRPTQSKLGSLAVRRAFDPLGRMTDLYLGVSSTPDVHFDFDGLGGPTARSYANGVSTAYHYDIFGRLDGLTDRKGATTIASWSWSLPIDGVPRAARQQRGSSFVSSLYRVDGGGRLTGEDHGVVGLGNLGIAAAMSGAEANARIAPYLHTGKGVAQGGYGFGTAGTAWRDYALDGRSNWLSRSAGLATLAVTPTLNLLDAYTTFGPTATYGPDGALKTLGNEAYTYNVFGELSDVQVGATKRRYRYDALGRRVTESSGVGTPETKYGFDGPRRTLRLLPGQTVPEATVDGDRLDEHLVRVASNGVKHYYHQDRGNSVYLITVTAAPTPVWRRARRIRSLAT